MQTEADAFLQRVRAYPDDDAPRLVFADWLDEEGDPRGRFIRVQLALAELPDGDPARRRLQAEEQTLLDAHRDEWEAPFRGLATGFVFRRGFVEELNVEARQFLRAAGELFAASPVRHVHLLDVSDSLPAVLQSPYLGRLSALTVHGQHVGEPLARAVARSEYLSGLRKLALTRNRLGDDAAGQLALAPNLANLEELDLGENEIGETGARALAASPHLGKLRVLDVRGNRFGPAGAEAVAGSERLASIQRLGLAGNDVGLPRLLALPGAHHLLRIPALDLAGNGLTPASLQAILHRPAGAEGAVRLRELDVSFKELGDAGARLVANCPHLAKLTLLRLANCDIRDDGARALAGSPHLNEVEELALENNPIDDAGFRPWLETPHWRALRRLTPPRMGISQLMRDKLAEKFNRPARRA
jgi:uncharacterized protein (TIGR02996 family)